MIFDIRHAYCELDNFCPYVTLLEYIENIDTEEMHENLNKFIVLIDRHCSSTLHCSDFKPTTLGENKLLKRYCSVMTHVQRARILANRYCESEPTSSLLIGYEIARI